MFQAVGAKLFVQVQSNLAVRRGPETVPPLFEFTALALEIVELATRDDFTGKRCPRVAVAKHRDLDLAPDDRFFHDDPIVVAQRVVDGSSHFDDVVCTYQGASDVQHPKSQSQWDKGRKYHWRACTNGATPGTYVSVGCQVSISIDGGDSDSGTTRVHVDLDVEDELS